jgi:hypothetical protein
VCKCVLPPGGNNPIAVNKYNFFPAAITLYMTCNSNRAINGILLLKPNVRKGNHHKKKEVWRNVINGAIKHTPLKNTEIACILYNTFPNMHNATRHKMD